MRGSHVSLNKRIDDSEFVERCRRNLIRVTYACMRCKKRFTQLERDGLCAQCHHEVLAENSVEGGTVKTIIGGEPPISTRGMSEYCGNGHKWKPETTRWRYRDRGGRHGRGWERDCLVCKDMADKSRIRMGRNITGRNVTVTIGKNGTRWNSGSPGGKEY